MRGWKERKLLAAALKPIYTAPSAEAATKLIFIWLVLRNITAQWSRASAHWKEAMNPFAILYGERFTKAAAS